MVCKHHPSRKRERQRNETIKETDQGQGGFVKNERKAEKIEEKL